MKKLFKSLAAVAFLFTATTTAFAQNAHEGRVKFMKVDQNANIADYDLPKDIIENALKERLEKAGLGKRSSESGFMAYRGATWTEIGPDKMDIYVKVDGKGNMSTITMLVSKGYDNFISAASDPEKAQKVQDFLNGFIKHARLHHLKLNIVAQEDVVKKAEKELKNTTDSGNKLQKEKEKVERQVAENKAEQEKKQSAIDAAKVKLEELKREMM